MTERAHAYLPIDRRVALVSGAELPTRVWGTVLEADLSGFTALTETLALKLGLQRGAEELARRLNEMFDGLLREVHRYGGTVLVFSGDAFTSWLDGDDGTRAVACAQGITRWMKAYGARAAAEAVDEGLAPPKVKVALATGSTRRFLVGDPKVQVLEGIAGSLVDELTAVEHGAKPGDIVLAPSTIKSVGERVRTGQRGVLLELVGDVADAPWPELDEDACELERVRPWLLPAVFDRLAAGAGDFIAELRPVTAMFVHFSGISFESDPAALDRLDTFVRALQGVFTKYEGTLLQVTIGDKGSYLYAAFGAPVAHEDDRVRALLAALEVRRLAGPRKVVQQLSIGLAAGPVRAGAYGGSERRTYGVLGDTVNLAARLMQAAGPGEIVATQAIRQAAGSGFRWKRHADLTVKGKSEPVPVTLLQGRRSGVTPRQRLGDAPMIGRREELEQLHSALAEAAAGRGQVVAVIAEAGVGKTRLVAELVRHARANSFAVFEGDCPSYGVNGAYVAWLPVITRLFGLRNTRRRAETARAQLAHINLAPRLPVLAPLLGISIPDNDLTRSLDPKVRKTALEATVAEWLRATVKGTTVIVIEDGHWIDTLSEDLLTVIARTARELPLLVIVTMRPRGAAEGGELAITRQPHYHRIALGPLTRDESRALMNARLAETSPPPEIVSLVTRLADRAEGNPFYLRELVDYIVGLGPAALDPDRLAELPSSLQSLILSRIDRLEEPPKATLKVASAVGRVFEPELLLPIRPELGGEADLEKNVSVLQDNEFVLPEAEDRLGFKHDMTQEVAYSTIVGDTRAALHGRIGRVLETRAGGDAERQLDLLAHHFGRGDDVERRRTYVFRAGEAAQARYANRAAIEYFRNVIPLLDGAGRVDALLKLGRSLGLIGAWEEAADAFQSAAEQAVESQDVRRHAMAETETAELLRKQGRLEDAQAMFDAALAELEEAGDEAGVAEVLHLEGTLAAQQGNTEIARTRYQTSLDTRRRLGDRRGTARGLNGLGVVAEYQGDLETATAFYRESLSVFSEVGDVWGVSVLTSNVGVALLLQDRPDEARPLFERAVGLQREIGDPQMLANVLSNLGDAARELGDAGVAASCYLESITISRELGERWLLAYLLEDVAMLEAGPKAAQAEVAVLLAAAAGRLREEIGSPLPVESREKLDRWLAPACRALTTQQRDAAAALGATMSLDESLDRAVAVLSARTAQVAGRRKK